MTGRPSLTFCADELSKSESAGNGLATECDTATDRYGAAVCHARCSRIATCGLGSSVRSGIGLSFITAITHRAFALPISGSEHRQTTTVTCGRKDAEANLRCAGMESIARKDTFLKRGTSWSPQRGTAVVKHARTKRADSGGGTTQSFRTSDVSYDEQKDADVLGEKGERWVLRPWEASAKNISDAGRTLRTARFKKGER